MKIKVFLYNNDQIKDLEKILDKFSGTLRIDTPKNCDICWKTDKHLYQEWGRCNINRHLNYVTVHAKEGEDIVLLLEYLAGRGA